MMEEVSISFDVNWFLMLFSFWNLDYFISMQMVKASDRFPYFNVWYLLSADFSLL